MDVRVVPKGQTFEQVMRGLTRELNKANRSVVKDVSRAGIKAIKSGAPTFAGKRLTARTDPPRRSTNLVTVTFYGVSAGAWAINENRVKRHDIDPRQRPRRGGTRKKALAFPGAGRKGGGYTMHVDHPGIRARHLWTAAGKRLEAAVQPAIEDAYDEALDV